MREGWFCPVCKQGVSPDMKTCNHGGMSERASFTPVRPGPPMRISYGIEFTQESPSVIEYVASIKDQN